MKTKNEHKQKHTQGPWTVDGLWIVKNGKQPTGMFTIGSAHDPTERQIDGKTEEREANVHLMAASPDMFDALQMVVAHEGRLTGSDWVQIHAAIDKARVE